MSTIDLNAAPPNHTLSVTVEREETDGERRVRLLKDLILFLVAVAFVVLIAALCATKLISQTATVDDKKWAMSVLSGATGGIVGYLVRRP